MEYFYTELVMADNGMNCVIILSHIVVSLSPCLSISVCLTLLSTSVSSSEILRAERLRVVHLSSHSAVLQWRPLLSADTGYYELRYNCVWDTEAGAHPGTSCTTGQYHKRTLPGDARREELTNLRPDTTYTASLTPESNQEFLNTLSVTFTTLPGEGGQHGGYMEDTHVKTPGYFT